MNKLSWCKQQKNGIQLIEPNDNLATEYFSSAEITLQELRLTNSNMWMATKQYYVVYFLAYALLMKVGIKSEIHSCTIELIKLFSQQKITTHKLALILEESKELRIQNQYYLKNTPVSVSDETITALVLETKKTLDNITPKQISLIREIVQKS
jgi:uncharacterized protein (UPF0332 family)